MLIYPQCKASVASSSRFSATILFSFARDFIDKMDTVLKKVNLGGLSENFTREKITPDLVGKLSVHELESLGVSSRSDMMALRMECHSKLKFGKQAPTKVQDTCGAPYSTFQSVC